MNGRPASRAASASRSMSTPKSVHLWNLRNDQSERILGPMERRIFGPRTGSWRLLDLLDRYGIKGTFFVPGYVAETYPDLLPAFVGRGHEVGLHGFFHEHASHVDDDEFAGALEASIAVFKKQIGIVPKGFRSPSWEMTAFMLAELKRRGLYDTSLMGFDHPYTIDGVTEIPVQWMVDDAIYFKFDGAGNDKWPPSAQDGILNTWIDEWTVISRESDLFMLTVHDWISGRAARIRMLEKMLDVVTKTPGVWIATVSEVAAHHAASANAGRYVVQSRTPAPIASRRFKGPADANIYGSQGRGSLRIRPGRGPKSPCGRSRRCRVVARRQRHRCGDRHLDGAERRRALALRRRRRRLSGPRRRHDRRGRYARIQCARGGSRRPKGLSADDRRRRQLVQLAGRGRRAQCFRLQLDLRARGDRGLRRGAGKVWHHLLCRGAAAGDRACRARAGTRLVRRAVHLDRCAVPGQISCQQRALAGRRSRAKGVRSEHAALQADAGQGENAQAAGAGRLSRLLRG